jgi:protein phosphatase
MSDLLVTTSMRPDTVLKLPELCLVVLIGASGAGKSSFARKHFLPTEIISSDVCRGWVADDENSLEATPDAFDVLKHLAAIRLKRGLLTVIDATSTRAEDRKHFIDLARKFHCFAVAIAFDLPVELSLERNALRPDRQFGAHIVRNQMLAMRRSLRGLEREGFRFAHVLRSVEQINRLSVERQPLHNNRKALTGPFDIIGDVHGCASELNQLLIKLGYVLDGDASAHHPQGRTAVFVGDLVDRGPDTPGVLKRVMGMVQAGSALCVAGNHEIKLLRGLKSKRGMSILDGAEVSEGEETNEVGRNLIKLSHGLLQSLQQLAKVDAEFVESTQRFIDGLVSHYVLDGGKLVVCHAGLPEHMHGRSSGLVRSFALYGDTTGETDEYGLPIRYPWAMDYRGKAMVVYGHTPVPRAEWLNNTICLDTGCVFGGSLTALRYPERELVQVAAQAVYYEPVRPLLADAAQTSAQQLSDMDLDLGELRGKLLLRTRFQGPITIREENSTAALEIMSRFAVDPKWLIYLPPTMAPTDTHDQGEFLEHPREVFAYYRKQGLTQVLCEEKHMGSRAVVVICRDANVARERFGVDSGEAGVIYTRTGRPFFNDPAWQEQMLERTRAAIARADWWQRFNSDWFCLDCELMPWSAKAVDLIKQQYAQVGAAALARSQALDRLTAGTLDGNAELNPAEFPSAWSTQSELIQRYVASYQRYSWPVSSVDDLRLAPFHLLASEGAVHSDQSHGWHMQTVAELKDSTHIATRTIAVDLHDEQSIAAATQWWLEMTAAGGEGMVVKPSQFLERNEQGKAPQPAMKCRGTEYLRIIYGPEYSLPENLQRLRKRSTAAKRSLAFREFALGLEALHRFVEKRPLRAVHECVFGVLALESEPVDPRL